jgi:hypothetical protein
VLTLCEGLRAKGRPALRRALAAGAGLSFRVDGRSAAKGGNLTYIW